MKRQRRRFSRGFGAGKAEYMWVTSSTFSNALTAGAQETVTLVAGSDWERGGAQARETCTLIRVVYEIIGGSTADQLNGPFRWMHALLVQDADEGNITLTTFSSNAEERWLRCGFMTDPIGTLFSVGTTQALTHLCAVKENVKQRVRLANSDEVRLIVRSDNTGTNVTNTYSVTARALLRLS